MNKQQLMDRIATLEAELLARQSKASESVAEPVASAPISEPAAEPVAEPRSEPMPKPTVSIGAVQEPTQETPLDRAFRRLGYLNERLQLEAEAERQDHGKTAWRWIMRRCGRL